jgi:hypothetical protein
MVCTEMNFDAAEQLRTELIANIDHLKSIKTKSHQQKFNSFVKKHDVLVNDLLKELDSLKEEFNLFKLHTLSTVENKQILPRAGKCVTNPFSIYVKQK